MKRFCAILLIIITSISSQAQDFDSLYKAAIGELQRKNYQTALDRLLQLDSLVDDDISADTIYARHIIGPILYCCDQVRDYETATKYATRCADIVKNVYGENHPYYANLLVRLANYYTSLGNFSEAIKRRSEEVEIRKRVLGSDHPDYASSLNDLAVFYSKLGNYSEAIRLGTEAMEIRKKVLGSDHPDYATSLSNLGGYYSELGDYSEAIRLGTEVMEIRKKALGSDPLGYATSLSNLANSYSNLGNYSEAIRLGTEAMEIRKKVLGTGHPDYALSLNNLAGCYSELGNYPEAIRLVTEAMEIYKKVQGTKHPNYAGSLYALAIYYTYLGNYSEAIRLGTEAKEIYKNVLGIEHPYYVLSLNILSSDYSFLGNHSEAIRLGTEAMEIYKKVLGTEHPYYALSLNNLANYHFELGNYSEAIRLGTEAMEIRKKVLGSEHPDFAISLSNLANYYTYSGNYSEAIRLGTKAMEIRKKVLGTGHPNYATSLYNLAGCYADLRNYNEALPLLKEYLSIVRNHIFKTFLGLSANERTLFWDKYTLDFISWIPRIMVESDMTEAPSLLYDNIALFTKGLLLSTEQEMTKLIQEKGDNEAQQMHYELHRNRQILNAQYSKPIAERHIDCDSLERVSNNLERQLVSRVKEFGDYTRNLSLTWRDVQSKLSDDDIAIEFLSYRDKDGEMHYAALTLCQNDTAPVLTPLFTDQELFGVFGHDRTYRTSAADSLIWSPLSSQFDGKSHVYFAASGLLHKIGIEYLPSMKGKECYRLSSTRELVTHQPNVSITSAMLYGDIDYDATYASIETSTPAPIREYAMNTTMNQNRGVFDYRSLQYGVTSLPGARIELEDVSALMKEHKTQYEALTGVQASEESFKAISGKHKTLLHISTHGFYYNQEDADKLNDRIRMTLMGDNRPSHIEDKSLLRCGLCFAGANQTLTGKGQPSEGQSDGILNALEIAQTDLRGLDLVVLSACQTALGDVAQGEGVFGLQRGFKKAGAKSILMSLWKVNDLTTQLLMTEFYKHYLSGQSKLESLKKAQEYVRNYEDEDGNKLFEDPYYWAGFILLDALD